MQVPHAGGQPGRPGGGVGRHALGRWQAVACRWAARQARGGGRCAPGRWQAVACRLVTLVAGRLYTLNSKGFLKIPKTLKKP